MISQFTRVCQKLVEHPVEPVEKIATQTAMIHTSAVKSQSKLIHHGVDLAQFDTGAVLGGKFLFEQKPLGTLAETSGIVQQPSSRFQPGIVAGIGAMDVQPFHFAQQEP